MTKLEIAKKCLLQQEGIRMKKQEFKDFCHAEFTERGLKKRKDAYWIQGKDFLCGIWFKKSIYGRMWAVHYCFYMGQYNDAKLYPSLNDFDLLGYITVLSKDKVNGEHFMGGWIEYELYTKEELKPYFDEAFDKHIIPAVINGKEFLRKNMKNYYCENKALFRKLGGDTSN